MGVMNKEKDCRPFSGSAACWVGPRAAQLLLLQQELEQSVMRFESTHHPGDPRSLTREDWSVRATTMSSPSAACGKKPAWECTGKGMLI